MKTVVHLMAMPLAYPLHPSSQLGYLHGFVEQHFGPRVTVHSYHSFLPILYALEGIGMAEFFETYSLSGEEILYLACSYQAAKNGETDFPPCTNFEDALHRYNTYGSCTENEAQQPLAPISREKIVALCQAMESYLDRVLIPNLEDSALNVVGFTASFCQVFGSIFAARHIRRNTAKRVLFVFGGSSYSLPEGSRTLRKWGVDGFLIAGSGEAPFAQLLEACLNLSFKEDPGQAIDSLRFLNVTWSGNPPRPISLAMDKAYMATLPNPNYDDYFNSLQSLCSDERAYSYARQNLISIPLEGSRGCFARCDFCHNPNITSEFRSLSGEQVAERVLAMVDRYDVPDITFVDSVSNTWAGRYADYLLAKQHPVKAFAEMRVHAPEGFWVKLALCGMTTIQLGIEAISEPLLRSMRKGTTVMQNLAATKYMAEMGTANASNLIIHHPKSTVADVEETRRVMSLLEHFPIFLLSSFVVSYASPIYNELSEVQKAGLHRGFDWLDAEFTDFTWPRHLSYTWPAEWVDPAVRAAWLNFQLWYADYVAEIKARQTKPTFTVRRNEDDLYFADTRFGQDRHFRLVGAAARIYDACHKPSRARQVADVTGLADVIVSAHLKNLVDCNALLCVGDRYLSIALRPREELIANLHRYSDTNFCVGSTQQLAQIDGVW